MKSNTISWLHREPEQENEPKSQTGKFDSARQTKLYVDTRRALKWEVEFIRLTYEMKNVKRKPAVLSQTSFWDNHL